MLSLHTSQVAHQDGVYLGFCSMKQLGVFSLPQDGMAVHCRVIPTALRFPVPIYTPGWIEAL